MDKLFVINDMTLSLPKHPEKQYAKRNIERVDMLVLHTTDANWTMEQLANFDIGPNHISNTGCPGVTYHDVIMEDGTVNHAQTYNTVTWHAGGYNTRSVSVAMMFKVQDSQGRDQLPSMKQRQSVRQHLTRLCLKFGLTPDRIKGHRELKGTGWFFVRGHKRLRKTCPGMAIDLDLLRVDVARYMQRVLRRKGYYNGNIDGDFGPKSKAALKEYKERFKV